MCGIAGVMAAGNGALDPARAARAAESMAQSLLHRGPDGGGVWRDGDLPVVLAHRRLAIIDLTPEGAQPMVSASGRYTLSYNGEIYDFSALRAELEGAGAVFRGHSDTEIMLAAFERWGPLAALERLNGMFAFALWDRREKILHLGRDRIGKKPLYVGWADGALLFASELKAFHASGLFSPAIDDRAFTLYMRHGFVPAPYSIYRNVWQMLPGHFLSIDAGRLSAGADLAAAMKPYWSLPRVAERAKAEPLDGPDRSMIDGLEALLRNCVQDRMVSDVPLGAFLSGGVDSSLVAALMRQCADRPVKTYCIGFREKGYDEAAHAAAVAAHLGAEHHELYVGPREALDVVPLLPDIYDEPFADASQIPTFLVSRFARGDVTVALSGDGGDDMLGGYLRHYLTPGLWRNAGWLPRPVRSAAGRAARRMPVEAWNRIRPGHPQFGRRVYRLSELMEAADPGSLYDAQVAHWRQGEIPRFPLVDPELRPGGLCLEEEMIFNDQLSYLPNDLMVKTDRASMAVALEVRSPLLDRRIAEYAWRLPLHMKIRKEAGRMTGKWILREVLSRHLPRALFERPKQGFSVPVGAWLKGPLKDWAETLVSAIDRDGLPVEGVFPVRAAWRSFLAGGDHHENRLWTALMFQAWRQRWTVPSKTEDDAAAESA